MKKHIYFLLSFVLLHQIALAGTCFPHSLLKIDTPDIIINNVTIVDVVNRKIIESGTIYIDKGKIISLTKSNNILGKKVIDGTGLVALPGFINTHTHLWQHISKSSAPNDKLQDWIKIYQPIHCLTEDEVYKVVLAACSEAMLSGITSVSDYASLAFNDYSLNSSCKAMKDSEMGGVVIWHNPSIFIPDSLKSYEIIKLQNTYKNNFDIWMGHGPLSFHSIPQVYSGLPIAKKLGMHISEHSMENIQEQRDFHAKILTYLNDYGGKLSIEDRIVFQNIIGMPVPSATDWYYLLEQKAKVLLDDLTQGQNLTVLEKQKLQSIAGSRTVSPFPLLQSWGILKDYLAIHAVWPQKEDLKIMRDNHVSISHNPESNMYLSSGIAPIHQYKQDSIVVTIGTDGAASNDGINFFSAMKNMWNLNKINLMNASIKDISEWDILQAATINGAKSLSINDKTGSIDVGKDADIILLNKETLGLSPYRTKTLPALIIYSGQPSSIDYVLSNGKIVVANRQLTNQREAVLARQLSDIANAADLRNLNGKDWLETFSLDEAVVGHYWYKYRSVRLADQFDLKFENKGKQKIKLYFVSAGQRFGGGSPTVIDAEVAKRFPENSQKGAFTKEIILKSKEAIEIKKDKGSFKFLFMSNGKTEENVAASGQILMMAFIEKK